ncbi:hypothetical protein KAR91_70775 [Candidatus Pacearchaeota archaeon]|nr:hypothetical protein [Candidatus Pacearchaeota archaeon]
MTSYQQRKKEIRELKSTIFQLEKKLNEHGIEFGQLTIDDKYVPTNILLSPEDMEKFQGHRNPSKPPPPKIIREGVQPPKPPSYRQIEGITFKKAFSKFWKWLKYWFSPREPYNKIVESYRNSCEFNDAINKLSDSIKFSGHRNPPPPPERVMSNGEITKNKECEELAATTPFTKYQFIRGYNLLIPYVSHSTIKHKLNLIATMCMRKGMDFEKSIGRYARICQDITKPKNKYLKRLRRRRKKRYSISTPITMAWKR